MKKIMLFLLVGLYPMLSSAEEKYDKNRFEMIKETVNFLAADSKLSKNTNFSLSCNAIDLKKKYECIESSITDKNFNKHQDLLSLIRKWDSKKENNSLGDLQSLKQTIFNDIVSPAAKKYRQKLPQYAAYLQKINKLAATETTASKSTAATTPPPGEANTATLNNGNVEDLQDSIDSLNTNFKILNASQQESTNYIYVALALAIISLIVSILSFSRKKKAGVGYEGKTSLTLSDSSGSELEILKQTQSTLQADFQRLNIEFATQQNERTEKDRAFENQLIELRNERREIIFDKIDNKINEKDKTLSTKQVAGSNRMYAKFIDSDLGGFTASSLVDDQNGERTFEIVISGDEAVYSISDDDAVQRYALQNFEYLVNACQVKGTPQPNGRIINLSPGTLSRSEEGNWQIVKKAEIELK